MAGWIVIALWIPANFGGAPQPAFQHVRSAESPIRTLVADGYARSPTVRALVDRVEQMSCVVYVATAVKLSQGMRGALLHTAVGRDEMPVLRVLIRANLGRDEAIAVIAHELQHVIEAIEHPAAGGRVQMSAVFGELDDTTRGGTIRKYETDAAIEVTTRVRDELRRGDQFRRTRKS